jgi:phosphoribosyl 1,2-cyclic phosphodiesterase
MATARYGGNTTCIEIVTDDGHLAIFDGGTGIRPLGLELMKSLPVKASIFISHTHWDHIQGLPFFVPLFVPGNEVHFYGATDPIYGRDIQAVLGVQMEYCYFPVRQVELKADLQFHTLQEGDTVQLGDATIQVILMNHPVVTFGYRIECNGRSVFFSGDHEPVQNIYPPEDDFHEQYQELVDEKDSRLIEFLRDTDVLILDAMYTDEEYATKVGWGHGTFKSTLALATKANAKRVVFTHHEPVRDDDTLDAKLSQIRADLEGQEGAPEPIIAYEGLEIVI